MRRNITKVGLFAALFALPAMAQLGMFTKDQLIAITSEWKGERFPDGRPKVPDEVLDKLANVDAEEAWGTLRSAGYNLQFESNFKTVNVKPGGPRLVGRVVTCAFVPLRPDFNNFINENGKKEGRVSKGQNSWVIDTLIKRDVMVVDLFGKIEDGTIIGDNLGTSIMVKTGTGLVVDGSIRDVTGNSEIEGFQVYARGFHPSALREVSLSGINIPIRIGHVTVLPGDVVVSDPEGLTFIPPQLAERVANEAERTHLVDDWGHKMLREHTFTPGEIDTQWTPKMIEEFNKYSESKGSSIRYEKKGKRP
jgi:4-hydroxy-4-methyl-2-oxoglutarate aldolase